MFRHARQFCSGTQKANGSRALYANLPLYVMIGWVNLELSIIPGRAGEKGGWGEVRITSVRVPAPLRATAPRLPSSVEHVPRECSLAAAGTKEKLVCGNPASLAWSLGKPLLQPTVAHYKSCFVYTLSTSCKHYWCKQSWLNRICLEHIFLLPV